MIGRRIYTTANPVGLWMPLVMRVELSNWVGRFTSLNYKGAAGSQSSRARNPTPQKLKLLLENVFDVNDLAIVLLNANLNRKPMGLH